MNLLKGFRIYVEKDDKASMVDVVKKQLHIQKKLWFGMPLILSNVKFGDVLIQEPTVLYVTNFDDNTVTLKTIPDLMNPDSEGNSVDSDGEIDIDPNDLHGEKEIIISRDDFYDLQKPMGVQAGQPLGGGSSGGLL